MSRWWPRSPTRSAISPGAPLTTADRHRHGVYYTPDPLADALVAAVSARAPTARSVVDPACGDGALLGAWARHLRAAGVAGADIAAALWGADIDAAAVGRARSRLAALCDVPPAALAGQLCVGDGLAAPPPWGARTFDVALANPPFGNAIRSDTARSDAQRADYAARFPAAATGAYDRAGLFAERCARVVPAGGAVGLIVPRALLAAPYASALRAWLETSHGLAALLRVDDADLFDGADVHVAGVVLGGGPFEVRTLGASGGVEPSAPVARPPSGRWGSALSPYGGLLAAIPEAWPRLDAMLEIRASASVGEAYEVRPAVTETEPAGGGFRLLTSGALDPLTQRWGRRPQRYLKGRFATPWIPRAAVSPRRAAQYDAPKVLLPGLSRVLEAWADETGGWAGAVATLAVTRRPETAAVPLSRVAALLNTRLVRMQFRALWAAQALGGGSVQVTKKKLGAVRLPLSALLDLEVREDLPVDARLAALDAALASHVGGEVARLLATLDPP